MKLDNTMLTAHHTCPSKYHLRHELGWASKKRSGPLSAGGAMHHGLAAWYKTGEVEQALQSIVDNWPHAEAPVDDWRTMDKCLKTMDEYSRAYPAESFKVVGIDEGNPMVEVAFCLETGMYLSCSDCGPEEGKWHEEDEVAHCHKCHKVLEPIEYGGIFDTIVDFGGSQFYILEHKTTAAMGQYYFTQFKPNNQVAGYIWAASKLTGKRVRGALINAIAWYKSSKTKFERHISTRNEEELSEFLRNVRATCEEIQFHRRTGYWPKRTSACTLYGLCEFHGVHTLGTERERQNMLETHYEVNFWDFERER